MTEHPEDDQRDAAETDAPAAQTPAEETPAADAQAAETPAEETPAADAQAAETPAPEAQAAETPAPEPESAEAPAAEAPPTPPAATTPDSPAPPTGGQEQPAVRAQQPAPGASTDEEDEEDEVSPRQKPEIPGADLIPDIIPEGEQFLDAEAQAAAEAEAEARAARQRQEADQEESSPIADAAIDLAAGARYTATGKRKTAVARVILKPGSGEYLINGKALDAFFPRETLRRVIRQPLDAVGYEARMDVVARMHGGGVSAQAEALRHGIARALLVADPNLRGELKRRGFLTRDPRVKERKKAGLKKARKRPQFSKR